MVAGTLLFAAVNSMIGQSSQNDFDQLINTYGESFAGLHIVGSFAGSGGANDNEKPDMDVTQDISGLYEKNVSDKRVEFAVFLQALCTILQVTFMGSIYITSIIFNWVLIISTKQVVFSILSTVIIVSIISIVASYKLVLTEPAVALRK